MKMNRILALPEFFLAVIWAAFAPCAGAQVSNARDVAKKLLNDPSVTAMTIGGDLQTHTQIKDAGVQGGIAWKVVVNSPGQPFQASAISILKGRVEKGDQILVAVWLKNPEGTPDTPGKVKLRLEASGPPYTAIGESDVEVGTAWKLYQMQCASADAYAPAQANLVVQFGITKQTVLVGPAFVLDVGPKK